jgi:hypothetical protein
MARCAPPRNASRVAAAFVRGDPHPSALTQDSRAAPGDPQNAMARRPRREPSERPEHTKGRPRPHPPATHEGRRLFSSAARPRFAILTSFMEKTGLLVVGRASRVRQTSGRAHAPHRTLRVDVRAAYPRLPSARLGEPVQRGEVVRATRGEVGREPVDDRRQVRHRLQGHSEDEPQGRGWGDPARPAVGHLRGG